MNYTNQTNKNEWETKLPGMTFRFAPTAIRPSGHWTQIARQSKMPTNYRGAVLEGYVDGYSPTGSKTPSVYLRKDSLLFAEVGVVADYPWVDRSLDKGQVNIIRPSTKERVIQLDPQKKDYKFLYIRGYLAVKLKKGTNYPLLWNACSASPDELLVVHNIHHPHIVGEVPVSQLDFVAVPTTDWGVAGSVIAEPEPSTKYSVPNGDNSDNEVNLSLEVEA